MLGLFTLSLRHEEDKSLCWDWLIRRLMCVPPVCVQSHSWWWPVSWCWRTGAERQRPGSDPSSRWRADGATFHLAAGEAASGWDWSSGPHTQTWRGKSPGSGRPSPACRGTQRLKLELCALENTQVDLFAHHFNTLLLVSMQNLLVVQKA